MSFDPANPNDPTQVPAAFPPADPTYAAAPVSPYAQPAQPIQPYPSSYGPDPAAALAGPVKVLGICYIILAVLGFLGALIVATIFPAIMAQIAAQAAAQNPGGPASPFPASFGTMIAIFVALFNGVLPLITGIGLLRRASWGRVMAIVNGVLALLNFPFGTVLGAFTLYYMLRAGAKEGYDRLSRRTV